MLGGCEGMTRTATDEVYDALHEMISTQELAPGDRLLEIPIAEKLGVSRTPVREAIRRLQQDGLVESHPNKGCFLKRTTLTDMADGYEVIACVSSMACRYLAERGEVLPPEEVRELKGLLAEMRELCDTGNKREWVEKDIAFHQKLINMAGHPQLISVYSNLSLCVNQILWLITPLYIDINASTAGHEEILRLIMLGNSKDTADLVRNHHLNTANVIRELHDMGMKDTSMLTLLLPGNGGRPAAEGARGPLPDRRR